MDRIGSGTMNRDILKPSLNMDLLPLGNYLLLNTLT